MARIISYENGVETLRKETMKNKEQYFKVGQVVYCLSFEELMDITNATLSGANKRYPKVLAGWTERMRGYLGKEYVVTKDNYRTSNSLRFGDTTFGRDMFILKADSL